MKAIKANIPEGAKRDRMLDSCKRYCAGESYRDIVKATGKTKVTLSADLHAVQRMIGKQFLPVRSKGSIVDAVANVTRVAR